MQIHIKRGLDLPLAGAPEQVISAGAEVRSTALLGADYPGVFPALAVAEGDRVRKGQTLFTDRKRPRVRFTAPAGGVVSAINRGARRALQSIVIRREDVGEARFAAHAAPALARLPREAVCEALQNAGLWTALRTRPFSRIPDPDAVPQALFVTAMDTNPWAPDPAVIITARTDDFRSGLMALAALSAGPTYVCKAAAAELPALDHPRVRVIEFTGPHPAGLPGTHIHFLDPVGPGRSVWHIGYQDVVAIGQLLTAGQLPNERVVALAGPGVANPRLLRTLPGAHLDDLLQGERCGPDCRVLSGSVLEGRRATGVVRYLGRYHQQISLLAERRESRPFGWLRGRSYAPAPLPALSARARSATATTALHGRPGGMVPTEAFERVLPLDIPVIPLLRALLARDTENAIALGALELAAEDLALCSFVCPAKYDYGAALRANLELIEAGR